MHVKSESFKMYTGQDLRMNLDILGNPMTPKSQPVIVEINSNTRAISSRQESRRCAQSTKTVQNRQLDKENLQAEPEEDRVCHQLASHQLIQNT